MKPLDVLTDFEDILLALERHGARCLVIGGLAFIYHVKPRYTKDMDIWVEPEDENLKRVNAALTEFGSPTLLDVGKKSQMIQIGVAPVRVDIITNVEGMQFAVAWKKRVQDKYGKADVNWIDLDSLIEIKEKIDDPRHKSDVRYLRKVKELKKGKKKRTRA